MGRATLERHMSLPTQQEVCADCPDEEKAKCRVWQELTEKEGAE